LPFAYIRSLYASLLKKLQLFITAKIIRPTTDIYRYFPSVFLRAKAECFARLCHRLGVCPSVCLSHSWTVSKRCKL